MENTKVVTLSESSVEALCSLIIPESSEPDRKSLICSILDAVDVVDPNCSGKGPYTIQLAEVVAQRLIDLVNGWDAPLVFDSEAADEAHARCDRVFYELVRSGLRAKP